MTEKESAIQSYRDLDMQSLRELALREFQKLPRKDQIEIWKEIHTVSAGIEKP